MGLPRQKAMLTPDQYLAVERQAEYRSEYFRGEMFAMAGGTREHSLIKSNLVASLNVLLKGNPCTVYDSDLRVLIAATGLYTYPDASVACEPLKYADDRRDTYLNPTLISEVLSEGSEAYDRGKKFDHYRTIDSLREYLIISQDCPKVERFARNSDNTWTLTVKSGLNEALDLISIKGKLSLADLYDKLEFHEQSSASVSTIE
jgi:Uma2 family endonuclease